MALHDPLLRYAEHNVDYRYKPARSRPASNALVRRLGQTVKEQTICTPRRSCSNPTPEHHVERGRQSSTAPTVDTCHRSRVDSAHS